jgi:uncharacterized protein involved in exopolysaccharide biosynthesis
MTAMSGLAAQFGIAVPGSDPTDSPQFYADLVRTRTVLDTVLSQPYAPPGGGSKATRTLAQILAPDSDGPAQQLDARKRLLKQITLDVNAKTNVVTVSVNMPEAWLAKAVAFEILRTVNSFTLENRQAHAHQERLFTEARTEEARLALATAESALESFLQSNRTVAAPRLEFAQDRLRRQVEMRQQLYTALAQAADQSRIEELRDTPSLTIVEEPELPLKPESRGIILNPLVGLVVGAVIGFFLAFGVEMLARDESNSPVDDASESPMGRGARA